MAEQQELEFGESQGRCGSCGGPAGDGELCPSCTEAFSSVLGKPRVVYPAAPLDSTATIPASSPAPQQPRRVRPELVAVAAVGIVAMIGIPMGARWLRNQIPTANANVSARAPVAVAEKSPVVHEAAKPAPHEPDPPPQAATVARPPAPEPARPSRVASATPQKKTTESRATRSEPAAPSLDFSPIAVAPLAHVAAAQPTAPPPPLVTAEPPAGRIFDQSDVDDAPRVAARVEPQLPGNVAGRAANDVVIVRILISQSGHPFHVNLLRRSKLGPSADEAVVAAVKLWTFSPARKRGEAVSCWFNIAVALAN